jgi:hypothetical protein
MSTKNTIANPETKNKGRFHGPFQYSVNTMLILSLCKLIFCKLTVCVTCVGADGVPPSDEKMLGRRNHSKNGANPQRQVHAMLGERITKQEFSDQCFFHKYPVCFVLIWNFTLCIRPNVHKSAGTVKCMSGRHEVRAVKADRVVAICLSCLN